VFRFADVEIGDAPKRIRHPVYWKEKYEEISDLIKNTPPLCLGSDMLRTEDFDAFVEAAIAEVVK